MNCADIRKYVYVYLDGEFEPTEQREFESHVIECAGCRDTVNAEQAFQQDFKGKMKPLKAPSHLRHQIISSIEDELSTQPEVEKADVVLPLSWPWRLAPLALAASLAAVVLWPDAGANVSPQDLAASAPIYSSQMAQSYSAVPVSNTGSALPFKNHLASYQQLKADVPAPQVHNEMRQWVSFRAKIPISPSGELKLSGARRVRYQGKKAVLFIYSYRNERISILQYQAPVKQGEPSLQLERHGAMTAGRLNRDGNNYWVISELDPETLSRLLSPRS